MDEVEFVRAIVRDELRSDAHDLALVAGGFFSRAWTGVADGIGIVVRTNVHEHAELSFFNDDFAQRHYGSSLIPIPRVLARGTRDGVHFAISEQAAGQRIALLSDTERDQLRPHVLTLLDALASTDVSTTTGYGAWDSAGNGLRTSWAEMLRGIARNDEDGYYANWHRLFDGPLLDRELFDLVFERCMELLPFCPEQRQLIHNDLHFDNLISDGARVTGVLDWANALYGDALWDVAWLEWQADHTGWWYDDGRAILRQRFGHLPHYAERTACYRYNIGLDHLKFYARNDNAEGIAFTNAWLQRELENHPGRS